MSLIPEISNPYLGVFAGGLFYGLAFCTSACLPYVTSYIAGIGAGFKKGMIVTLIYNSGRITAYALIGGLIGLFSGLVKIFVTDAAISPYHVYSSLFFGVVTILIGLIILFKNRSNWLCKPADNKTLNVQQKRNLKLNAGAFSLGFSRGLIVCPPLIALLLYTIPFGNPIDSLSFAVLFGLGTALSPILLLGGLTGWLLNKAPLFRKWISIAGAMILIVLGIGTILNAILQLR
jgi:sulfite exporter TauE/SafE